MNRFISLAVAVVALSSPVWAKGKQTCEDRCKDDTKQCTDICHDKGGAKMLAQCKSMCGEGLKYCTDKCKKKGGG